MGTRSREKRPIPDRMPYYRQQWSRARFNKVRRSLNMSSSVAWVREVAEIMYKIVNPEGEPEKISMKVLTFHIRYTITSVYYFQKRSVMFYIEGMYNVVSQKYGITIEKLVKRYRKMFHYYWTLHYEKIERELEEKALLDKTLSREKRQREKEVKKNLKKLLGDRYDIYHKCSEDESLKITRRGVGKKRLVISETSDDTGEESTGIGTSSQEPH
jgi:hypothetical protein